MIALLRNPIFAVGVLVVLAFAFVSGAMGAFETGALADVPAQESLTYKTWTGTVQFMGGRANAGTDFVDSWDPDGFSEVVKISGSIQGCAGGPTGARYRLYVDGVEQKHANLTKEHPLRPNVASCSSPKLTLTVPPVTWAAKGSEGDHVLRVVLEVYFSECNVFGGFCGWRQMGVDGARLLDGYHYLALEGSTTRFAEGETATFRVKTGNGGPWKVEVYRGTGEKACGISSGSLQKASLGWDFTRTCSELVFPGAFDGHVKFFVPFNAFRADGKNEWKLVLSNAYWKLSEERLFVIDNSKLAPEVPKVTLSDDSPNVGDWVTVKLEARANAISKSAITKFTVNAWYGSQGRMPSLGQDIISSSHEVTARLQDGVYVGEFSFQVGKASPIRLEANAIDGLGRPSGTRISAAQASELEEGGLDDPNTDGGEVVVPEGSPAVRDEPPPPAPRERAPDYLLAAVAVFVAVLAYLYVPLAPHFRALVAGLVAVGGLAFAFGVVP